MDNGIKRSKTICMWCHAHCKVVVKVKDGLLLEMEGDKEHPAGELLSRTVTACHRARAAVDWFYNPEHLNYPLKRAGEKGQGNMM